MQKMEIITAPCFHGLSVGVSLILLSNHSLLLSISSLLVNIHYHLQSAWQTDLKCFRYTITITNTVRLFSLPAHDIVTSACPFLVSERILGAWIKSRPSEC